MSRTRALLCCAALALVASPALGQEKKGKPAEGKKSGPEVEVVFCLDTTGSMGGLIDAAKSKIWAICNQIAGGKPTPRLRVGLVAFRDRGDAYVTKVHDLTDDLDAVYANLMAFKAEGGGDFPESVNQALNESVTKIGWGKGKRTLKIIFLVGDAPPHMDYPDDVKYPQTCKLAVTKDIIINTIQCGDHPETKKYWQEICRLAEGSYVQIDAKGGPIVAVATPFDDELAKINTELARSTLTYGRREHRAKGDARKEAVLAMPKAAAADRAAFSGRTATAPSGPGMGGFGGGFAPLSGTYDLLSAVKDGKVKLKELKKDELPEEMKKLSLKEQEAYLAKVEQRRKDLNTKAADLAKKRGDFIAAKLREDSKNRARDSFDGQVLTILQRQAGRVNIRYEAATEGKKK
jgi:Mg-chelatase subunit ChlD